MRAQGVEKFGERYTARTTSPGAPGRVHPRRILDRELPQLRRGAARPALFALRSAREGAGALARHAAARPAWRHHELRLAHLAHAEAPGVQSRHAHRRIPARAAHALFAAIPHVPDPERRVLPADDGGRQSGRRVEFRGRQRRQRRREPDPWGRRAGAARTGKGCPRRAPPTRRAPAPAAKSPTAAPKLDPQRQRIVDEIVKRIPDPADRAKARAELEQDFGAMTPEQIAPMQRLDGRSLQPGKPQDRLRARGQENRRPGARRLPQDRGRRQGLRSGRVREHPEDDVHLPAADRRRDVRAVPRLRALLRRAPVVLRALPRLLLPVRHRDPRARTRFVDARWTPWSDRA